MMNCKISTKEAHIRCRAIVDTYKKYNAKDQRVILEKYRKTNRKEYKDLLISANYPFVYKIASEYAVKSHHSVFDLFIEGVVGLGNAADKYDLDKEVNFITYAVWHIRERILKYMIVNYGGLISVGQLPAKKDAEAKRKGKESGLVMPSYTSTKRKGETVECIFDNMSQVTFNGVEDFEEEQSKNFLLNKINEVVSKLGDLEKDIINLYFTKQIKAKDLYEKHKISQSAFTIKCAEVIEYIQFNISSKTVREIGYDTRQRH